MKRADAGPEVGEEEQEGDGESVDPDSRDDGGEGKDPEGQISLLARLLFYLERKPWAHAVDYLVENVVTFVLSVLICMGCSTTGAWIPAAGAIRVAALSLWRWTVWSGLHPRPPSSQSTANGSAMRTGS